MKSHYSSISEAIAAAQNEGYTDVFTFQGAGLHCSNGETLHAPEDIQLVQELVFEEKTDPGSEERLLILQSEDHKKGYLIAANPADMGQNKLQIINALYRKKS